MKIENGGKEKFIPKYMVDLILRRQDDFERRIKRLEYMALNDAENKIASLQDTETGKDYTDDFLTIEEILNKRRGS